MKGDTSRAAAEFGSIFSDSIKGIWNTAKENFFDPLKTRLFGKDEDGNAQGIFSGTRNMLNDTYKSLIQKINGKTYVNSKGETVTAEPGTSLLDSATKIFGDIKENVNGFLFGKKHTDESGKEIQDSEGAFGFIKDSFKKGVEGWSTALFGDDTSPEEAKEKITKTMKERLPNTGKGAAIGAMLGTMAGGPLGSLIGGAFGGAAIGGVTGFLSKSEKFNRYLFGTEVEDENGNKSKVGGLISDKTQKFFKDNKSSIITGGVLGAIKSFVFPSSAVGLLGNLVGGPFAGAALGAASSMIRKSETFQNFLYGDPNTGKQGIIDSVKKIFGGKGGSGENGKVTKEDQEANKRLFGMASVGAVGGGLSAAIIGKVGILGAMATPAGPLGGAILGAATGIAAGGAKFREFLFGKKDPETGDKKGGLLQKFGNYVHVELFAPMKSKAMDLLEDAKITLKYDILETIRLPFSVIADKIGETINNAKDKIIQTVGGVLQKGYNKFIAPVVKNVTATIIKPARKVIGKAVDIVYNFSKAVITAPFKLINKIGLIITNPIRNGLKKLFTFARDLIGGIGHMIKNGVKNFWNQTFGRLGKAIKNRVSTTLHNAKDAIRNKFFRPKTDEDGNVIGTTIGSKINTLKSKLTSSEWRKGYYEAAAKKSDEKRQAKANSIERKDRDYNRQQVAKILGYDVKYFTADTLKQAQDEALAQGKTLKLRKTGKDYSFDEDPQQVQKTLMEASNETGEKQLSEAEKQTDIQERILKQMLTEGSDKDDEEAMIRIAAENGMEYNPKTKKFKPLTGEAEQKWLNRDASPEDDDVNPWEALAGNAQGSAKLPTQKSKIAKWFDNVENSGGLFKYVKSKFNKESTDEDIQSQLFSMGEDNSEKKSLLDKGKSLVSNIFKRKGKARAEGGPVNPNSPVLVGDGGPDLSAAEIFVPRTAGKVLAQGAEGLKVQITSVAKNAKKEFTEMFQDVSEKSGSIIDGLKKKNSYEELKKAAEEKEEQEGDNEREEKMLTALESIAEHTGEHKKSWFEVFSKKKGIVTLGAIAIGAAVIKLLPNIIDGIKNILPAIKDGIDGAVTAVKGIAQTLGWWQDENAGTDEKSTGEQIQDEIEDAKQVVNDIKNGDYLQAANDFVLDEGQWDANSGSRTNLLVNVGRDIAKSPLGKLTGKVVKGGAKLLGKGVKKASTAISNKIASNTAAKTAEKAASSTALSVVERVSGDVVDSATGEVISQTTAKIATQSADDVAEKGGKTLFKTIISKFTTWIDDLATKLLEKYPNIAESKLGQSLKTISEKAVKAATEKQTQVTSEVAAATAKNEGGAALTAGISTAVFLTVGAINGVSGTARLFQVSSDKVDNVMRVISAIIGAVATATTLGAIVDVISGIVAEVCGFDLLNAIACIMYGVICGEDAAAELNSAKEEWQAEFVSQRDESVEQQYETQKAAGIIDSSVTLEQFQEGVSNGDYSVSTQSFQDWNADQNQSIGYKIGKTASNVWKSTKTFFTGKASYTDSTTGNKYVDNGDGTFTVYDSEGNNLGDISQEAVNTDEMNKSVSGGIGGLTEKIKSGWNTVKEKASSALDTASNIALAAYRLKPHIEWAWVLNDGSGYYESGNSGTWVKYTTNGDETGDTITDEDMNALISSGLVTKHIKFEKGTIATKVGEALSTVWDGAKSVASKAKEKLSTVWNSVTEKASSALDWAKQRVKRDTLSVVRLVSSHDETVYECVDGTGYYKMSTINGWDKCGPEGDETGENITDDELNQMIESGLVTQTTMTMDRTTVKEAVTKNVTYVLGKAKGVVNTAKEKLSAVWDTVSEKASNALTKVTNFSKKVNKALGNIEFVWSLVDGTGYYRSAQDGTWEKYTLEDDPTGETITDEEMQSLIDSGLVVKKIEAIEGTLSKSVKAKISEIKDNAISTAKEVASNALSFLKDTATSIKDNLATKWDNIKSAVGVAKNKVKNLFTHTETVWQLADGSGYYKYNGSGWEKCTTLGDATGEVLTDEEFQDLVDSGLVVEDTVTVDGTIKIKFNELREKVTSTFTESLDGIKSTLSNFKKEASDFITDVRENGFLSAVNKKIMTKSTDAWYTADGAGYYVANSDGNYDYYTINGDLVENRQLTSDEFNELLNEGTLVKGEIIEDSEAKKALDTIKTKTKEAWTNAKDTVKNKWNSFTKWLTGASGTTTESESSSGGSGVGLDTIGGNGKGRQLGFGGRGTSTVDTENNFAYYSQNDASWKNSPYTNSNGTDDGATMGDSGCGPTAMAMVASQGSNVVTPTDMAQLASASGFRDETGTNEKFIDYAGSQLGLRHTSTENPSEDYIKDSVGSGRPVILNGVSDSGSAFTPSGHYVVAVGLDDNGNVLVNDPRGKSYSKAYSAATLANNTRKAWSFGGNGRHRWFGGRGYTVDGNTQDITASSAVYKKSSSTAETDLANWIAIITAVKQKVAEQAPTYNQSGYITITVNGQSLSVRTDCTGIITAMLKLYGAIDSGTSLNSNAMLKDGAIPRYFTRIDWPGWDNLQQGDIMVRSGHAEIFAYNDNNSKHHVWNGGSTNALCSSGATYSSHSDYTLIWRLSSVAQAALSSGATFTILSADEAGSGTTYSSSNAVSTSSSSSDSSSSSSGGFTSILSKIGQIFSNFASSALNGLLTGDWSYNKVSGSDDGTTATVDSSSTSTDNSSSSSSSSTSAATVATTNEKQKIWDHLRDQGYNKYAASGIMGCWETESSNTANRVEGDFLPKYPGASTVLADNDSMNDYTENILFPAYKNTTINKSGYKGTDGNYYPGVGLAQWTGSRGYNLFNYAKENGGEWGDTNTQLKFFDNEMANKYSSVKTQLSTVDNVEDATRDVLDGYEMSAGFSSKKPSWYQKRLANAKGIYNLFGVDDWRDDPNYDMEDPNDPRNNGGTGTRRFGGRGDASDATLTRESLVNSTAFANLTTSLNNSTTDISRGFSDATTTTGTLNTSTTTTSGKMEELIANAIKILEAISTNTGYLQNINSGISGLSKSTNVLNTGSNGNVIISNSGNSSTNNTTSANTTPSKNSQLASQIAKG
jgi:hypothetical protein